MKKICYTIILNDYDKLKDPLVITEGWDYICFTNTDIKSDVWKIVKIPTPKNVKLTTREYFICPYRFFDYNIAVMIGGQMQINCNLDEYVSGKYDIGIIKHKWNTDQFMEINACEHLGKINKKTATKIRNRYKKIVGKKLTGVATGGTVYYNNKRTRKLQEYWWLETLNYCHRDQITFPLAAYLNSDVRVKYLDYNRLFNQILYFKHNGELIKS